MKILVIFMLMLSTQAFAGPRNVGNGGGGLVRDGVYMTFGSARVQLNPDPMREIAGLDLAVKTARELKISANHIDQLLRALLPLGKRKYFNVVKEKFDEKTYLSLKEEYSKLTKMPPESITIFAITNPETRETFLLPEFFGLKTLEQAAILFHEAYWVIKPEATYEEVVRGEIAFQKYIEARSANRYEYSLAGHLQNLFYSMDIELSMHLNEDLSTGALETLGANSETGVPLIALLSPDFHCDNHSDYHWGKDRGAVIAGSGQFAFSYDLSQRYPNSNFLRFLVAKQSDGEYLTFGLDEKQIKYIEERNPQGSCYNDVKIMDFHVRGGMVKDGRNHRIILDQRP